MEWGPQHWLPTVSEPNVKLRCKPKKLPEGRKNPLRRKGSAPSNLHLRRRPAETLGGEGQSGGEGEATAACSGSGLPSQNDP